MTDLGREVLIGECWLHCLAAPNRERQRYWMGHMQRLVRARPAHVVLWMERDKGLRA